MAEPKPIYDEEKLNLRADNLNQLNGLKMVLVSLGPAVNPTRAVLELYLYNSNQVAAIVADVAGASERAHTIFPVFGGVRVPAGSAAGQVQVTNVVAGPTPESLNLTVEPIGDYSTYTLGLRFGLNIDPLFNDIDFRFRPGCFTTDCSPAWCPGDPALPVPAIDYLAKDFDSFKHTMIVAMGERVPRWQPTSEADLDQVLIELFSGAADELSDFQDRVMSEAYLGTARKRASLARHARLMDYHIHQGNQASTWLALEIAAGTSGNLPAGLNTWTGGRPSPLDTAQVFVSKDPVTVDSLLNNVKLYTWGGAIPALAAGKTRADLELSAPTQANVDAIVTLINDGKVPHLLLQEHLNPATGHVNGFDPAKRQLLTLVRAEAVHDPDPATPANAALGTWVLRVSWLEKLTHTYCFEVPLRNSNGTPVGVADNAALFHGNLARVHHGRMRALTFVPPDQDPGNDERNYELPPADLCLYRDPDDCSVASRLESRLGVICRLPDDDLPLLYTNTPPGGDSPAVSTLHVEVTPPGGGATVWHEQPDLVHSRAEDDDGNDFVVETDEELLSLIRFGNGTNGMALPGGSTVACTYQVGYGPQGNVGFDAINGIDPSLVPVLLTGARVWNPFDGTEGRAPELAQEIIRRVPEAYRARQLRAVTLADYVKRAEEVPGVARAAARYAWTGSWRTVRIAIDPESTTVLSDALRTALAKHLEAVRLIGEDIEIRPPVLVPLSIDVSVCIKPEYWPQDVRFVLEQELSDSYTPDGRLGFFNPDAWTFGQELHVSEILGRIHQVEGVEHLISVRMKRWDAATPGTAEKIALRANEIILVENDPDQMERGSIRFDLQGGRQ